MRKSRYTDEQMVKILREADRSPVADVAKKHGVSEQTIYVWRQAVRHDDGRADTKRLRALEQENGRLKKLVAERDLEIEVMKEIARKKMVSAPARRQQVAYASARGLSQRRACALLRTARSALRYESTKAATDAPVVAKMRELAGQYPRYGYRRIRVFLGRDGHRMSADRAHRLWRGAQLQVPRKRPRRRVAGARPKPTRATGANQVWAYDFVFDACANGQQLKCLTVIDEYTREALAIDVAGSIRSGRVIEVLAQLVSMHGAPRALRSDNGPEFVSRAILRWLTDGRDRLRAQRSRQAVAERHRRELQRQAPRRVPEHGVVSHPAGGDPDHRNLAAALQRGPAALEPRLPDPDRVQKGEAQHDEPQPGEAVSQ